MKTITALMTAMNTPVLTILCLAGFLWLGHVSQRHENLKTLAEFGYTEDSAARFHPEEDEVKPKKLVVATAKDEQEFAEMLADVLSVNDTGTAVVLYRKGKRL